jgi:hypothetical protein
MKKLLSSSKFLGAVVALLIFVVPLVSSAISFDPVNYASQFNFGLVNCGNPNQAPCDFNSFVYMLNGIINWFIAIAVSIAALTFAYAGYKILVSGSSSSELNNAKEMLRKSVYGMVLLLGCWLIIYVIMNSLTKGGDLLKFLQK